MEKFEEQLITRSGIRLVFMASYSGKQKMAITQPLSLKSKK
jgi:hypothetical protein